MFTFIRMGRKKINVNPAINDSFSFTAQKKLWMKYESRWEGFPRFREKIASDFPRNKGSVINYGTKGEIQGELVEGRDGDIASVWA